METHPKRARAGTPHKLIPYMVSFMAGGLVLAALLGGYVVHNTSVGKSALEAFARSLGYDAFLETGIDKLALVRAVPGNFVRDVDMPRIVLDIKFEHWQKILVKRNGALARGILIQEAGDFVPTSIRYSDGKTTRTAKAKLRLKGDWIDHLQGKKWSFRIRTKGKDQFFGMRRFSLQKPETRTFQLAPMFLSLTRDLGIISLRYFFADVTINGTHIGVMAVEEHPAKELLEASGRKESVIIRFSEKYLWNARVKSGGGASEDDIFDDYRMAPIDAFQSSRIAKSSTLSNNYRVAAGLLRGFTDGRLSPSEVFDAELMGRFLAAAELFGARHGIIWHNLRFYYNPQTALLEPLPFDMTSSSRWDAVVTTGEPIIEAMLADQAIGRAFRARLKMLIASVESDELLKSLAETEARHLPRLQSEYVLHGRFPLNRIAKRASMLKRELFGSGDPAAKRYDQIVFARVHSDGRQRTLTLFNAVAVPVTVSRVYVAGCPKAAPNRTEFVAAGRLPLTLPAAKPGTRPEGVRLGLDNVPGNCSLMVDSHLADSTDIKTIAVDRDAVALDASPIPASSVAGQLAGHDFLAFDADSNELRVATGDHVVRRDIVVPAATTLSIAAGTTLRFAPNAAIVAHGPVAFSGTADAPVILRPADDDKGWQGIAVLRAGAKSRLKHTRVVHTTGVVKPGWALTGGVTFYESDVDITSTTFTGHRGEDALNIVRSDFTLDDALFEDTLSDAFDSDFSTGRITRSRFFNIGIAGGGDAVDTSGSAVEISGVRFHKISDKAISVGEASSVEVHDVVIEDTGTGLASKDRSRLKASRVSIRGAKFAALIAYTKKPEYGGAVIIADDITIDGNRRNLVQFGSRIVLAGREIKAQNIDIDTLYDTIMKAGAR